MFVCCECCQVEVSATDWSLVQGSPTNCGASLCVIKKPCRRGSYSPLEAAKYKPTMGCSPSRKKNSSSIWLNYVFIKNIPCSPIFHPPTWALPPEAAAALHAHPTPSRYGTASFFSTCSFRSSSHVLWFWLNPGSPVYSEFLTNPSPPIWNLEQCCPLREVAPCSIHSTVSSSPSYSAFE
jgi:hypothetical protein